MLLSTLLACSAPESPSGGLGDAFNEAAETYDVPVEVLVAVSFEVSRFDQRGGEPNREGGVGVMNLREGAQAPSLSAAAALSGQAEGELRDLAAANIAGAAALMRAAADANAGEPAEASLEVYYPVVAAYAGASDPAVAEDFAARVFDWIQWGLTAEAPTGERLSLDPTPLPWRDNRAPAMGSGLIDQYAAACSSNYSSASRSTGDVDYVVIHTTQGSYSGAISWFQNCSAEVSAHYTVRSSDGHITQSVDEADVAWHAGNSTYNWSSIGIEHEGYVDAPETWYTEEMYRSSAALTADICDRHGIPKDRSHIIGHSEVPNATHTDPGSGWDWDYYLCLVNGTGGSGTGGLSTCYADDDGDGYGDAAAPITACGGCPSGTTSGGDDCDDGDAAIHPDAVELCDAVDNDCEAGVDEGYDLDADGYRTCDGDCDDQASGLHPGAVEAVDGVDNDCDWRVDEGSVVTDDDLDGWSEADGDCDDADAFAFPGAPEMPDGEDDDCDGSTDEGTVLVDDDGDGWSESAGDCHDGDARVYPGSVTVGEHDTDCDGRVGEGTSAFDDDGDSFTEEEGDCDDANRLVWPDAPEVSDGADNDCNGAVDDRTAGFDDDHDGWTEEDGDCNDANHEVYPTAEEHADGVDQDCDWLVDDRTVRFDDDHDGWTEEDGDCDDAAPGTFPGAIERADAADNDCNGVLDDRTVAVDDDGDGYAEQDGDCDDLRTTVFPGGTEALDALDNDCDGLVDDETSVFDDDGDGWTEQDGDCDDGDAHTRPGAVERIDGEDTDCDGLAERPEGWLAGCATSPAPGSWPVLAVAAALTLLRRPTGASWGMARCLPLALLVSCSDYGYSTKDAHAGGDDTGAPWIWTAEDTGGPGAVTEELDGFIVEGSNATDFVFFGDTSNSMTDELVSLGAKMEEFVATLAAAGTEWQLAAVTGPDGCIVGDILDPRSPDPAAAFSAAILTPPGADDVDEWGLYNVAQVVENTDVGECNAGLLRANATLHAVFLSDENDDSPGSADGDPNYWQVYVDQIVAKKGSAASVALSAIAGPLPSGCDGADPGNGYYEATTETGGEFISLCEDWPTQVNLLATASLSQARYPLTRVPVVETLEVHVDGAPNTADWSYVPDGNYVEFATNIPESGQYVEVHYLAEG